MSQPDFARHCGVSEKQLGEWESPENVRVNIQTIKKLAGGCQCTPADLILHESPPELIVSANAVIQRNMRIVQEAREFLFVTGSRSRDKEYLDAITQVLRANPNLLHRRVLFGPPRTEAMHAHIAELLEIKSASPKYVEGNERLVIAFYEEDRNFPPEAAVCMNEREALIVLPSTDGTWKYNTAIVFEQQPVVKGWKIWIESIFTQHQRIDNALEIPAIRGPYA